MALLNFKYGAQADLKSTFVAGTVYITSDTKKLFVDNPHGDSGRICLGDFQLVTWTKSSTVTSPAAALNSYPLKDTNTLYITVEAGGATAMWRYVDSTTGFKAISNSEEIAELVADIEALQTAVSALNTFKDTTVPDTYMPKAGGTFSGNVAMASGKTLTVNTPSANGHAATKKYVDDAKSALLGSSSATTTNNATIYDVKRAAEAAAAAASSAATAASNANNNANGRVSKAGDTMTGLLTLSGAPTADLHAATKKYVDDAKTSAINTAASDATNKANAVLGTSDDDADDVTVYGAIAKADAAASAASNANDNANNRVAKSGDTMTGFLTLHAAPTSNLHAATKKYVDDAKSSAISTAAGDATTKANAVLGTSSDDADANTVYGAKAAASAAATTANNAMPKAGGTFTGNVTMGSGKTLTVNTPSADGHAATKAYVDSAASTAKTGAESTAQGYVNALKGASTDDADAITVYGAIAKAGAAATAASNAQEEAEKKAPIQHASTATTYGIGTNSNYGHVKLSDATSGVTQANGGASKGIAASTYAVTALRTALVGTTSSASSTATIYGAKKYADEKVSALTTVVEDLKDDIGNLSNIMNFVGVTITPISDRDEDEEDNWKINIGTTAAPVWHEASLGDVVIYQNREYVCVKIKQNDLWDPGMEDVDQYVATWAELGDVTAQDTAISDLQDNYEEVAERVGNIEGELGNSNDLTGTVWSNIEELQDWKTSHATEYSNLARDLAAVQSDIGLPDDDASTNASTTGSLYARVKKNASDINGHATRIGALETWKTSHANEYTALANRVTALETWKGTHTTAYNNLSDAVSGNSTAINNLTTVLTWGTF